MCKSTNFPLKNTNFKNHHPIQISLSPVSGSGCSSSLTGAEGIMAARLANVIACKVREGDFCDRCNLRKIPFVCSKMRRWKPWSHHSRVELSSQRNVAMAVCTKNSTRKTKKKFSSSQLGRSHRRARTSARRTRAAAGTSEERREFRAERADAATILSLKKNRTLIFSLLCLPLCYFRLS